MIDLLGRRTPAGLILRNAMYADADKRVVSWSIKCATAAIMFVVQLYFIFSVLLYGANKGRDWQIALITSMMLNLAIEQVFSNTISSSILNYAIPNIVQEDIGRARRQFHAHMSSLFDAEDVRALMDKVLRQSNFSMSTYMFSSNYISQAFPELMESVLVLTYRNPMPPAHLAADMEEAELRNWASRVKVEREEKDEEALKNQLQALLPHTDYRSTEAQSTLQRLRWQRTITKYAAKATGMLLSVGLWIGTLPLGFQSFIMDVTHPLVLTGLGYLYIWWMSLSLEWKIICPIALFLLMCIPYINKAMHKLLKKKHQQNAIAPVADEVEEEAGPSKKERAEARRKRKEEEEIMKSDAIMRGLKASAGWEENLSDIGSIKTGTGGGSSSDEDDSLSTMSSLTSVVSDSTGTSTVSSVRTADLGSDLDGRNDNNDENKKGKKEGDESRVVSFADQPRSVEALAAAYGEEGDKEDDVRNATPISAMKDGNNNKEGKIERMPNSISKFSSKIKSAGRAASVSTFLSKVQVEQQQKEEENKRVANQRNKVQFGAPIRPPVRDPQALPPKPKGLEDVQRDAEDGAGAGAGAGGEDEAGQDSVDALMYDINISSGSDSDSDSADRPHRVHTHAHHKHVDKVFKKMFTKPKMHDASTAATGATGSTSQKRGTYFGLYKNSDVDLGGGMKVKAQKGATAVERRRLEEQEARIRREALAHAATIDSKEKLEGLSRGLNSGVDPTDPFLQAIATNTEHDFLSEEHRLEFDQLLQEQQQGSGQTLRHQRGRGGRGGRGGRTGRGRGGSASSIRRLYGTGPSGKKPSGSTK